MKIMCLVKITCPLNIPPFPPTFNGSDWAHNLTKYSQLLSEKRTTDQIDNQTVIFLFDSEEELNSWASECKLTDPLLISDMETWKKVHGITFTYEYYSVSQTIIGPDPII